MAGLRGTPARASLLPAARACAPLGGGRVTSSVASSGLAGPLRGPGVAAGARAPASGGALGAFALLWPQHLLPQADGGSGPGGRGRDSGTGAGGILLTPEQRPSTTAVGVSEAARAGAGRGRPRRGRERERLPSGQRDQGRRPGGPGPRRQAPGGPAPQGHGLLVSLRRGRPRQPLTGASWAWVSGANGAAEEAGPGRGETERGGQHRRTPAPSPHARGGAQQDLPL